MDARDDPDLRAADPAARCERRCRWSRFSGAYETPLSNAQIFDSGQYPGSDGALPTIYVDGGEDQTTYVRPPLSATDANAADNVTQQGDPVSLIVYENQPPLVVTATQSPVAGSQGTTEQVTLGATVTTADGTAIPSSALTFSWTVDGTQPLSGPTPVATVEAGVTPVTVQVYDQTHGRRRHRHVRHHLRPAAEPDADHQHGPGAGTPNRAIRPGRTKLTGGGGLDHAGTNRGAGTRTRRRHSKPSTRPHDAGANEPRPRRRRPPRQRRAPPPPTAGAADDSDHDGDDANANADPDDTPA